jgi:peptidoglycan/LPS O-acetylase OafA/YrhL
VPTLDHWRSWGWIGVDLFFVISGYLITSILISSHDRPNYYRNFYARRGLRIWPLYYLLLFYVFALSPHLGPWCDQRIDFSVFKWQYYIFYVQNLELARLGSFCLVITWSLCVEEQFYLVWPFIVRLLSPRRLIVLLLLGAAAGTPFRMFLHHITSSFGFFYTFTRLDAIAMGALVALRPRWFRYTWLAAPVAVWLLEIGNFDWNYLALALTFGSLVSYAVTHKNRFLAARPLRHLGRISYSMYIWHPLVFLLYQATPVYRIPARYGFTGGPLHIVLQSALTVAVGTLSYTCVEKPILKLKKYFQATPAPAHRESNHGVIPSERAAKSPARPVLA